LFDFRTGCPRFRCQQSYLQTIRGPYWKEWGWSRVESAYKRKFFRDLWIVLERTGV